MPSTTVILFSKISFQYIGKKCFYNLKNTETFSTINSFIHSFIHPFIHLKLTPNRYITKQAKNNTKHCITKKDRNFPLFWSLNLRNMLQLCFSCPRNHCKTLRCVHFGEKKLCLSLINWNYGEKTSPFTTDYITKVLPKWWGKYAKWKDGKDFLSTWDTFVEWQEPVEAINRKKQDERESVCQHVVHVLINDHRKAWKASTFQCRHFDTLSEKEQSTEQGIRNQMSTE